MPKFINDTKKKNNKKNQVSLNSILSENNYNPTLEYEKTKEKKTIVPEIIVESKKVENNKKKLKKPVNNKPIDSTDFTPNKTVKIKKSSLKNNKNNIVKEEPKVKINTIFSNPKKLIKPVNNKPIDTVDFTPNKTVKIKKPSLKDNKQTITPNENIPNNNINQNNANFINTIPNIKQAEPPKKRSNKLENNIPEDAMVKFVTGKMDAPKQQETPQPVPNTPVEPSPMVQIPQPVNMVSTPNIPSNNNIVPTRMNLNKEKRETISKNTPKKKISPIVLIAIVLLAFIVFATIYYFVFDTPKKMFINTIDKIYNNNKQVIKEIITKPINYKLNVSLSTQNEDILPIYNFINDLAITGTNYINENTLNENIILDYQDNRFININMLKQDNNLYIKLDELLDYPLSINNVKISNNISDYEEITDSLFNTINQYLKKAKYNKKLLILGGGYTKVNTLIIDQIDASNIITNSTLIDKLSTVIGMNSTKLANKLEKIKLKSTTYISIYSGLINNHISQIEIYNSEFSIHIEPMDNKYSFSINNMDKEYSGEFSKTNLTDSGDIILSLTNNSINSNYRIQFTYNVTDIPETINITDAKDYNKKQAKEEIFNKLREKEPIAKLLEDLGMTDIKEIINKLKED